MRALAARFPGALREIDLLPDALLDARIAELEAVCGAGSPPPRWACAVADYHAWMRIALTLRREAGPGRDRARAIRWIETLYRPAADEPPPDEVRAVLHPVLHPPEGRLNRWIFTYLAPRHGLSPGELESEIFPPWSDKARSG